MLSPNPPDLNPDTILIILHQEWSTPGRVGMMLQALGYKLDIRRPVMGEPLPETMENHAGAIIFGGPMSANEPAEYIRKEIDWISVPLKENAPFFGICLGAQMLSMQLGGSVTTHPEAFAEVGYYPLRPTQAGLDLMPHWPDQVYHWHTEGFDLPKDAILMAEGDYFPNQAYQYGDTAFGVQFHAELTLRMMYRWTTLGAPWFSMPGAKERKHHFEGRALHDGPVKSWLESFLSHWLTTDARV